MAQRSTVLLVGDVEGSAAKETADLVVNGASCGIDLTREHAEALRAVFEVYVAGARRTSGRGAAGRAAASTAVESGKNALLRRTGGAGGLFAVFAVLVGGMAGRRLSRVGPGASGLAGAAALSGCPQHRRSARSHHVLDLGTP